MDNFDKDLIESIVRQKSAVESRKEDDLYFEGAFWIIANSLEDIYAGNFEILSEKFLVNYEGKLQQEFDANTWSHQKIWETKYTNKYQGKSYKYFPRGRIVVKNGKAYFNCPYEIYLPQVVDAVTKDFCIGKLEHIAATKSSENGSHYDFELE